MIKSVNKPIQRGRTLLNIVSRFNATHTGTESATPQTDAGLNAGMASCPHAAGKIEKKTRPIVKDSAKVLEKVPGPPKLPVVGAINYLTKNGKNGFHDMVTAYHRDFGWISKMEIMGQSIAMVFHPDDIRTIYASDGKFPASPIDGMPAYKYFLERRGYTHLSIASIEYDEWKKLRVPLQKHILPPIEAASYLSLVNPVSRDFSKNVQKYQDDLSIYMNRFTFEVIFNVMFDERMGALEDNPDPENLKFIQCARDIFGDTYKFSQGLPLWKLYDTKPLKDYFSKADYGITRGTQHVEKLMKRLKENPDKNKSYLGRLVASNETSVEQISFNVSGLLTAGVDTTSQTLNWIIIRLAQYPEVQEKLYKQVYSVLKGEDYSESAIGHLPYLKDCMKESFRLDSIGPVIPRHLQKDVEIRGHNLPAGLYVYLSSYPLLRDPKYFDNPEDFIPERWSEEEKKKRIESGNRIADHPSLILPFSFGPRMCLGSRLAHVELNSLVSRLVQDYKFELLPNQKIERSCRLFVEPTVYPKLRFTPRN